MIRVGLLGCGTVGGGVVRLLAKNQRAIAARVGAPVVVARAAVRDLDRARVPEIDRAVLTTDASAVVEADDIDVVLELMGGVDPTLALVERALAAGKQVVTANKMLLAQHGPKLLEAARSRGVDLAFEASVGGGIPVIRALSQGLAGDEIVAVTGILNGTSNFVLTRMQRDGASYDAAVREAQELGYAEADPTLDVGGHDAAHKLVVLSMLAFGVRPPHGAIDTQGIEVLSPTDHVMAARFGFAIKPLAVAVRSAAGVSMRVGPELVPLTDPLSSVGGVLGAVAIEGAALGPCLLVGRGAGELPTAVSVVGDLIDLAAAKRAQATGRLTAALAPVREEAPLARSATSARHYLRFSVYDRPGVLARLTGALGEARVSIEQLVQQGGGQGEGAAVEVVVLTHRANDAAVRQVVARLDGEDFVARPCCALRVAER